LNGNDRVDRANSRKIFEIALVQTTDDVRVQQAGAQDLGGTADSELEGRVWVWVWGYKNSNVAPGEGASVQWEGMLRSMDFQTGADWEDTGDAAAGAMGNDVVRTLR
jgi:hypothetical protein